ncbi:hypothetical protein V7138_08070 [Bacillus sp. JJ1533]|uniref:hypothetical protein n=1 Tax=Bacillus sp. JJ1533 TaxID=3122959 RepID=UPI002FFFA7C9
MKKSNWFSMRKQDKLLFVWVILSFIILYGPWGWYGEDGRLSFLFYSSTVLLILIPVVSMIIMSSSTKGGDVE